VTKAENVSARKRHDPAVGRAAFPVTRKGPPARVPRGPLGSLARLPVFPAQDAKPRTR
jgi:hypothetical protein